MILWVAQGFGSGRLPIAPGTAGSAVGILWLFLLLAPGHFGIYLGGVIGGFFASVVIAGKAERILGQTDPGSIVIDEIAALPLCFLSWIVDLDRQGEGIRPDYFLPFPRCVMLLLLFAAFRVFDVLKPWPVRPLQKLRAGWGVTVDDYAAALYVNVFFLLASAILPPGYV